MKIMRYVILLLAFSIVSCNSNSQAPVKRSAASTDNITVDFSNIDLTMIEKSEKEVTQALRAFDDVLPRAGHRESIYW